MGGVAGVAASFADCGFIGVSTVEVVLKFQGSTKRYVYESLTTMCSMHHHDTLKGK
jgi:hypothetical protein